MSAKVVKVALFDSDKDDVYTYDGNLTLNTTVKEEDKNRLKALIPMGPLGFGPAMATPSAVTDDEAAKNAAVRILQEKFKTILSTGFSLLGFGFGIFPRNLQVDREKMKKCEVKETAALSSAGLTSTPTSTASAPADTSILFCYKLSAEEKKSITSSSGSPFVGYPVIGIPPYILSSDPYTAAFLARRYEPFYPTMRSLPIFSNYANRLETNYVPAMGFETRSYSPSRGRERERSPSPRERSSSPRSRRHREKYLKYKQKYLQLKNSL